MSTNSNVLARDFDIKSLIKFTLPSILMLVFISTYTMIDGIFISNLVGEDALAAVNIVIPVMSLVYAITLMFSIGGNAIVSKYMGEGKLEKAREFFTLIYLVCTLLAILMTLGIFLFSDQILTLLGTTVSLYDQCLIYLRYLFIFTLPMSYQILVQSFIITIGKPTTGLILTIFGGLTNIVLDYLLISPDFFDMGIAGAAIATGTSTLIPGLIGSLIFLFNKKGSLYFVKTKFTFKTLGQAMFNGSSEFVGNISVSITTVLYNAILLNFAGEAGVAAISTLLYLQYLQMSIYFGFTIGVSPIISYKYGEKNHKGLKKIIKQAFIIVFTVSIIVILLTLLFNEQAISMFISKDSLTFELTKNGLMLFLPAYLFMGINIMMSSMFTALNNGKISALISFARSLIILVTMLILLPMILGLDGVWVATPITELLTLALSVFFYRKYKKKYGY